jgi:hypothetical protein
MVDESYQVLKVLQLSNDKHYCLLDCESYILVLIFELLNDLFWFMILFSNWPQGKYYSFSPTYKVVYLKMFLFGYLVILIWNAFLIDLNILNWKFQNLVAVALGSVVSIWNGKSHNGIENIDLSFTCNYLSSVSW